MDRDELLSNYVKNQVVNLPNLLNDRLFLNSNKLNERNEIIQIKEYINEFMDGNTFNRFIVLPGLRGVGKTTLLFQVYDYLLRDKNVSPQHIFYFSCEDLKYLGNYNIGEVVNNFLKNYPEKELMTIDENIFLLIDESQYDKNWALAGKIIYDKTQKIFMIFTGSSALNLETNADASRRMIKYDINPLNFRQYLKLRYNLQLERRDTLDKILFDADINEAIEYEKNLKEKIINLPEYNTSTWDNYLKYGGFPTLFYRDNKYEQQLHLMDIISKIVNNDMSNIKNFTTDNLTNVDRVISQLALQRSSDLSQFKLSKNLQTSISNINNILDVLEKTHLIFHVEAYGTSSKRTKKSWKYYFATSSLKHAISSTLGNNSIRKEEYEGLLLENMIASLLHEKTTKTYNTYLFYDSNKKNVDFIIQRGFQNPIPIEVGRGKKDKKQIIQAMKTYKSSHGIIISNSTTRICKEDNIIYIPYKTFSLL